MSEEIKKDPNKWQEFLKLSTDEKIQTVNNLLKENPKMTVKDLSQQHFEVAQSTFSSHLSELGYEKIKGQYVLKSNKKIVKENKSNDNKYKVSDSNKNITLEMYSNINQTLCSIESDELETVTLKLPKSVHDDLKEFLEAHKILKKQDVVAVAIKDFLDKYK